jgi:hypothetical protein
MKKVVLASLVISAGLIMSCSDKIRQSNVPSVVQNSLMQTFQAAADIEWEKEAQNYEAEFVHDSVQTNAIINPAGVLLRYKQEISQTQLPSTVMQALQAQYKEYEVEEVEKVGEGNLVYYQVELEKGIKEMQLVLAPNGTINTNKQFWD